MRFIRRWFVILGALAMTLVLNVSHAASTSIVGNWQTRSDQSGEPNSVITIWRSHGLYFGKISKIYSMKRATPLERCVKCKGALYNRPILGLVIIHTVRAQGTK